MKAVILAGGLGTRISEETSTRPKPMVEVGGRPLLWHIMKIYSQAGIHDFIICLGYKGYVIKEYFANYFLHMSDVTFDMAHNKMEVHQNNSEPWRVTLLDTGEKTMTGGRLKYARHYLTEDFCMTYGDGVADIDIRQLINFHKTHKKLATVTGTQPPARFGLLDTDQDQVLGFREKPESADNWINAGFFVLSPRVLDYIANDDVIWERTPLEQLASEGQLRVYKHNGFWQPMDTLRDKLYLEHLWAVGHAPWKIWSSHSSALEASIY